MRIRNVDYIEISTKRFAIALDKARDKAGLTIEQVCDLAGVSKQYWHNLHDSSRDGLQSFEWPKVSAVIKALGCDPGGLGVVFPTEKQEPSPADSAPCDVSVLGYRKIEGQWKYAGEFVRFADDHEDPEHKNSHAAGWYKERQFDLPDEVWWEIEDKLPALDDYYKVEPPDGWLPLPVVEMPRS